MYDIIIIGAGPAGLTSAIYARRALKKVLVLEALSYGGQIINTLDIENYPSLSHISGFDFATNLYNQAKDLGTEIIFEKVIGIKNNKKEKKVITNNNTYKTKTIIIATGSSNRKLGITDEDKLIGRGISYCATCDGAFYKNKDVAVVGGGNTAVEDAIYLADIAKRVYVILRGDKFRADLSLVNQLKQKKNIKIIYNSNVSKLNSNDKLESIEIIDNNNKKRKIKVSGLFVAIGRIPMVDNFSNIIDIDKLGYIKAFEDCHTNIDGIYVAGDVRSKDLRQLVTAVSDGAVAVNEALKYITTK